MCKLVEEGGLNIRRVKDMNNVGVMKHIWWLVENKESLSVRWIHEKYLKQDSIWTVKAPSDCSWSWRKLIKIRDMMEKHTKVIIGNGLNTWLWLDNWHPKGVLIKQYGDRIRYGAF